MASSHPPLRHGPCVTSKHSVSRNLCFTPYCSALLRIPGTSSLPFSWTVSVSLLQRFHH